MFLGPLLYLFAAIANAVLALYPFIVAALAIFGIYALFSGRPIKGVLALVLAATPLIAYFSREAAIEGAVREDAVATQSRPKSGPLTNWPSILVVNGRMNRWEVAKLMIERDFSRVMVASAQDFDGRSMSFTARSENDCSARLKERILPGNSMKWEKFYYRGPPENDPLIGCLEATTASIDDLKSPMTALILTQQTRKEKSESVSHVNVIELRLREFGVEELVDLWENPYRKRLMAPWAIDIRGFARSSRYDQPHQPRLVDFVLKNLQR